MTTSDNAGLAVVTGASSGIGFELARQFVDHGYDVLVVAENKEIEVAADELGRAGRGQVIPLQADLADYDGCETLYRTVIGLGRAPAALAINAGVTLGGDFVRETDLITELNIINLNVTGTVHIAKRLLPEMLPGGGHVLITSSIVAEMPGPYQAIYNASKSFVQSFTLALREELSDTGVTVTSLMPGVTDTDVFRRGEMLDTRVGATKHKNDPADVARQGFEAMMKGKQRVVAADLSSKLESAANKVLPDSVKAKIHKKIAEPGSAS